MIRVLAVTPWDGVGTPSGQACGIANYAAMAKAAIEAADPGIVVLPEAAALDPVWLMQHWNEVGQEGTTVTWLNYHRGLHSRWTPEIVRGLKAYSKVVITFHDTYGERSPDVLAESLYHAADAFIVHEPCLGLGPKACVIRQGIPPLPRKIPLWTRNGRDQTIGNGGIPVLGTCGFNFPWKNFDRLAAVTADAGWGYVVVSSNATPEDAARWRELNPETGVISGYQTTEDIIRYLGACDATAFPYECANSGTSGAIRLGIAARKPVLAFPSCRQFRDLAEGDRWHLISWPASWDEFAYRLTSTPIQRVDPGVTYLATRDSWARQGQKYAAIFRNAGLA